MKSTAAYPPELYALIHRGNPGDAAFYASESRGLHVLELGCGYGRLIPGIAKVAASYQGLELDPGFLKLAKRERTALPAPQRLKVRLSQGDMRDFSFKQRFDRVFLPYSTLYCLSNQRDVLRCLTRVREHLAEGGELVLDAYLADTFHSELDPAEMTGKERDFLAIAAGAKATYQVFERTRWSRAKQTFKVVYEYESGHGKPLTGTIHHRYWLRRELEALLSRAGFSVLSVHGDFDGKRLGKRSELMVVRARPTQS